VGHRCEMLLMVSHLFLLVGDNIMNGKRGIRASLLSENTLDSLLPRRTHTPDLG